MKKFLSISGWNPEVDDRQLNPGDYVAFHMSNRVLRIGIAEKDERPGYSGCAIRCLTNNKVYHPYSQDILLFSDKSVVKELTTKIIER